MKSADRKTAIRDYKERKREMGAFAVRCSATGQAWVGTTKNLDTHRNQIWFSLKLGSYRHAGLQEAWNANGEGAFTFEVLSQLSDEETRFPDQKLKDMKSEWAEKLGADPI